MQDSASYIGWLIAAIALVAVAARRANTCQGDPVRPPASPPSPSPAGTLEPPPPRLLPQWNPFIHPDGQGSVQEHCEHEEEEHVYEVVALGALRVQLAREEDAREQDTEPLQPAALLSHDSENSLYGIFDS